MPSHMCSYFRCSNNSTNRSMFRFPTNDVKRLQKWLEYCGNMTLASSSPENLRSRYICVDHFDKKYLTHNKIRKRLHKTAIPDHYLFPDGLDHSRTPSPAPTAALPTKNDASKSMQHTQNNDTLDSSLPQELNDEFKVKKEKNIRVYKTYRQVIEHEMITRVYSYLKTEYEQMKELTGRSVDLSPLANILKRTAAATGVSEHTVKDIVEEQNTKKRMPLPSDNKVNLDHNYFKRKKSTIVCQQQSVETVISHEDDRNGTSSSSSSTVSADEYVDRLPETNATDLEENSNLILKFEVCEDNVQEHEQCNAEEVTMNLPTGKRRKVDTQEECPSPTDSVPSDTLTTVKTEPIDEECQLLLDRDPLETRDTPDINDLHCLPPCVTSDTTLDTVKTEPEDEEMDNLLTNDIASDTTLAIVKSESEGKMEESSRTVTLNLQRLVDILLSGDKAFQRSTEKEDTIDDITAVRRKKKCVQHEL